MSIIGDNNKEKLSQNGFKVLDYKKDYEEFCKKIGGKVIKLNQSSDATINPLNPIIDVYGIGKEEFVEKLSAIMNISIIKTEADYTRITIKENLLYGKQGETVKQILDLCKSMSNSVSFERIN